MSTWRMTVTRGCMATLSISNGYLSKNDSQERRLRHATRHFSQRMRRSHPAGGIASAADRNVRGQHPPAKTQNVELSARIFRRRPRSMLSR